VVDNSGATVCNNSNAVVGNDSGDGSGDAAVGDGSVNDSGENVDSIIRGTEVQIIIIIL